MKELKEKKNQPEPSIVKKIELVLTALEKSGRLEDNGTRLTIERVDYWRFVRYLERVLNNDIDLEEFFSDKKG